MGQNSASYVGPKIWNNLINECKLEENLNKFKHKIKDTVFRNIQRANDDIYIYIIKNRTDFFSPFFLTGPKGAIMETSIYIPTFVPFHKIWVM